MPLEELSTQLGIKRAAHLLRRATFGASKTQIDVFANLTPQQAVQRLFRQSLPDPVLPIDPENGQEWLVSGATGGSEEFKLGQYYMGWFISQMASAGVDETLSLPYSAREKIVFFLHTHFTCIASKVQNSRALYFQNQLFRQFALDDVNAAPGVNFKNLTVKVSVDNAMLRLLDGNLNVKGNPNENYARELLELYSIGRGLEGTLPENLPSEDYFLYTETDVQAAAKVLSGWEDDETFSNLDAETNLPRGKVKGSTNNASSHNNEVKIFSERFANKSVTPDPALMNGTDATEASTMDEVRQLIDLIYSKRETVKNICWKIYRFYVYSPHDKYAVGNQVAKIDEEIIEVMADTFINSGYKIQVVIENLLSSTHFYDAAAGLKDDNYGGMIKSPLDLILGTFRAFDVKFPNMIEEPQAFYEATTSLLYLMRSLGMNFYEPFDVAGYEAYHQFPIYNRMWITPGALAIRYDFIRHLFRSASPEMFFADAYEYVNQNFSTQAADARQLILSVARYLLPVTENLTFDDADGTTSPLTQKRLNFFKERFLQDFDEAYWSTRWNEQAGDLREQLEFLFNVMLQSPEYQLA